MKMISIVLVSDNKTAVNRFIENKKKEGNSLIFRIAPKTKEFGIDQIKKIIGEVKIYHPKLRIYFFENFQLSSTEAQNSFLKILEEPPTNTQFILSVDNIHQLVPTIISRAKVIYLDKKREGRQNDKVVLPTNLSTISSKEEAIKIIDNIIFFFRKRLTVDIKAPPILNETLKIKQFLENNNLNSQLALDHLLIFIKKRYNGYNGFNDYKNNKK